VQLRRVVGSPGWARTSDPLINSQVLYRLSYRGMSCIVDHLGPTIKHEHGQAQLICRLSRFIVAPPAVGLGFRTPRADSGQLGVTRKDSDMKQLAAAVLTLMISTSAVGAQSSSPTPPGGSTIEIRNTAEIAIVFDISCDQGNNWDAMKLDAGTNNTYYCTTATTPPSLWFRVVTQLPGQPRREVRAPLVWKSRHEIVWDHGLEMWFLRLVSSP
jgi:hypothetical protein